MADEKTPVDDALAAFDPADLPGAFALGAQLLRDERFPEAIALLERIVAIAPEQPLAYSGLVLALLGAQRVDDALDVVDRGLAFLRTHADGAALDADAESTLLTLRAVAAGRAARLDEAHADALRARTLLGENRQLGSLLDGMVSQLASALPPGNAERAVMHALSQHFRDALDGKRSVPSVLGISDEELIKRAKVAKARLEGGDSAGAARVVERLAALDRKVSLFRFGSGLAHALLDELPSEDAVASFDEAVREAEEIPNRADLLAIARLQRGLFLHARGETERAAIDLRAALAFSGLTPAHRAEAHRALSAGAWNEA